MGLYLKKELPFGVEVEYWKITSVNIIIQKKYIEDFQSSSEVEFVLSGYVSKKKRDEGKDAICYNTFKCSIDVLSNTNSDIREQLYQSVKLNPEWLTAEDDALSMQEIWHESSNIQIKMTLSDNVNLIKNYPELAIYIKLNDIKTYIENDYVFIYVNYLLDEHKLLLQSYNAEIKYNN